MSDVTNLPRQSYFRATLQSPITAAQTSGIILSEQLQAISGTIYLNLLDPNNVETISCTGQSGTGELTGVTRAVATYSGETATAYAHGAGITIVLSDDWNYWQDMATSLNDKVNIGGDTMTGLLQFSGATNPGIKMNNLTTAQRDALTPANGEVIYNTTTGELNVYQGGAWVAIASGSTQPNGSTTVAGKYQTATVAQQLAATATGSTGAQLVPVTANMITTSAGAGDAGKIAVLNASGVLDTTIVNATATPTADKVVISNGSGDIDRGWINFDVQTFTANGTWTKPSGVQFVEVIVIGAGGGGGSGARADSASLNASGGGGGGGGAVSKMVFSAAQLAATETVVVGVGGTAGTAQTSNNSNGSAGGNGGESSFGTWLKAGGGGGGNGGSQGAGTMTTSGGGGASTLSSAVGTTGGTPATTDTNSLSGQGITNAAAAVGKNSEWGGASAGGSTSTGPAAQAGGSSVWAGPAGGSGGAKNGVNTVTGGAGGANQSYTAGGGGAGGAAGVNGTAGSDNSVTKKGYAGSGGGGGGSAQGAVGGNGGNGGAPGGGAGGGGASNNGFNSGAGGVGGRGEVRVYSW